jgi:hypothetical protein
MRVSPDRRVHILDGDTTGGGHGPGRGIAGKSEFPTTLGDDEIIAGIEAIANDPASYAGGAVPTRPGRVRAFGTIRGVRTTVIVDPAGEGIVTAWPEGVARNP